MAAAQRNDAITIKVTLTDNEASRYIGDRPNTFTLLPGKNASLVLFKQESGRNFHARFEAHREGGAVCVTIVPLRTEPKGVFTEGEPTSILLTISETKEMTCQGFHLNISASNYQE